jgi:hypothetical protein
MRTKNKLTICFYLNINYLLSIYAVLLNCRVTDTLQMYHLLRGTYAK